MRDGDNLRSIAQTFWGDESLWFLIASANGLNGTEPLPAGMVLVIPNKVTNIHNKSTTFRVYDPNQAIGDISPTAVSQQAQAAPPKKKHGCGGVGQILVAIVAIAVTAFIAPYAIAGASNALASVGIGTAGASVAGGVAITAGGTAIASGAGFVIGGGLAAAAGSIASQGLAVATGLQSKFDWSGVALAALSGGIAGGLGGALPNSTFGGNAVLGGAVRGAAGNAISQGVSMVAGLQGKFDWSGVAVGGVVGASTAWAGGLTGIKALETAAPFTAAGFTYGAVTGVAGAVAGAATRSLLNGTDFGDNIRAVLPDVIASTIGNAVAGRVADKIANASERREIARLRQLPQFAGESDTVLEAAYRLKLGQSVRSFRDDPARVDVLAAAAKSVSSDDVAAFNGATRQTIASNYLRDFVGLSDADTSTSLGIYARNNVFADPARPFSGRVDASGVTETGRTGASGDSVEEVVVTASGAREPSYRYGSVASTVLIGSGMAAREISAQINQRPTLRYALTALEVAAGPVAFVGRTILASSPLGAAWTDNVAKAANYVSDRFTKDLSPRGSQYGYTEIEGQNAGLGAITLGSLAVSGTAGALRNIAQVGGVTTSINRKLAILRAQGFQEHHIISPTNSAVRNHPLLSAAGYDLQGRSNKIVLPNDARVHPTRAIHIGRHEGTYSSVLKAKFDETLALGRSQGWTKAQYRAALDSVVAEERAALRNGDRALNSVARPGAKRAGQ